jgi:Rieske Fe-S protein
MQSRTERRFFLKTALASLAASALWLMDSLAKRTALLPENDEETVTVPLSIGNAIRFHDRMVVITSADGVAVVSSTCPHLGCRINRAEGAELVCPCHGSRFNARGEVVHGPATRNLQTLPFVLDRAGAMLHVTLKK